MGIDETPFNKRASILENTKEYRDIADIVLYHHESYDGNGYPDKRKGNNIPVESRIIAIADTYDAITNERPYSKAIDKETAIKEIKRCAGTQLDPQIVDIFINEVNLLICNAGSNLSCKYYIFIIHVHRAHTIISYNAICIKIINIQLNLLTEHSIMI